MAQGVGIPAPCAGFAAARRAFGNIIVRRKKRGGSPGRRRGARANASAMIAETGAAVARALVIAVKWDVGAHVQGHENCAPTTYPCAGARRRRFERVEQARVWIRCGKYFCCTRSPARRRSTCHPLPFATLPHASPGMTHQARSAHHGVFHKGRPLTSQLSHPIFLS
jgi:hypothetical protein